MTLAIHRFDGIFLVFFRKTTAPEEKNAEPTVKKEQTAESNKIRCPHCAWQPRKSSLWSCGDCAYPEFFFAGCYTAWNTFETKGRCPGCQHQWRYTSCLRCGEWSLHENWYGTVNKQE